MKARIYLLISILSVLSLIIPQPVQLQITPGVLTFHEANDTIVYNWFSYVPESITKSEASHILITGIRAAWDEGKDVYDYYFNEATEISRGEAEMRSTWADTYKYIMLVPVIPRGNVDGEHYYPASLEGKALLESTPSFFQRPDLKVNLMMDELIRILRNDGYNVNDKAFIEGFSVSAMFAQRYCLLHPERVQAIATGQCGGSLTVPGSSYEGMDMNWPVGVNDFQTLVGYDFNISSYQQVRQFIYIGDQDNGPPTTTVYYTVEQGGLFTQSQIDFLNDSFGDSDPVRLENQCDYMKGMGCNVEFKLYTGVGHQYTSEMINDLFAFFDVHKVESLAIEPDSFEEDDTFSQANVIFLNNTSPQHHNFHDAGDNDWIKFYGISGEIYEIKASNLGARCDAVIELYDTDGTTLLKESWSWGFEGEDELMDWSCSQDAIYYVKVSHYDPSVFGEDMEYDLEIYRPIGPFPGFISGTITDASSGEPVEGVQIRTDGNASALSLADGNYLMIEQAGTYTLTASATGYDPKSYSEVVVPEAGTVTKDFSMAPTIASLTKTEVSQLYVSIFGRASEGDGNSYWMTDPASTDMTTTANIMLNTDAAKTYFGTTMDDNAAFVAHIYTNTLGKSYNDDPTGQDYWVSELVAGKSKGEMIAALITAAQLTENAGNAQDQFNNKVEVSNYCADTIAAYTDLDTFTGFIADVTDDDASVTSAKELIDNSGDGLTNSILNSSYSLAIFSSETKSHAR